MLIWVFLGIFMLIKIGLSTGLIVWAIRTDINEPLTEPSDSEGGGGRPFSPPPGPHTGPAHTRLPHTLCMPSRRRVRMGCLEPTRRELAPVPER